MRLPRLHRPLTYALLLAVFAGYFIAILSGCIGNYLVLGKNTAALPPCPAHRQLVRVGQWNVECWIEHSGSDDRADPPGDPPAGYVIFMVGKESRVEQWIDPVSQDIWRNRNVEVWGMNMPGSGTADALGPARLDRVAPDALAVYDHIRHIAGDRPIFIQAGSFGTTAALCIAAHRRVAGLLLANPPPLRQVILGHYGWWNLWLLALPGAMQIPPALDSIANARHCTAPCIFLMSGADTIIPPQYHEMVYRAYAGPKRRIDMPGVSHDGALPHSAAVQQAKDVQWLFDEIAHPAMKN
jgi:hypothetical protein